MRKLSFLMLFLSAWAIHAKEIQEDKIQPNAVELKEIQSESAQSHKAQSQYFALLEGCQWGYYNDFGTQCKGNSDGAGDIIAYYKLMNPLVLEGKLTFGTNTPDECNDPELYSHFVANQSGFGFLESARLSGDDKTAKHIQSLMPKWFLDGLMGEVVFAVRFEVTNRKEAIKFYGDVNPIHSRFDMAGFVQDEHVCGMGNYSRIHIQNLTITQVSATPSNRDAYENIMMLALRGYEKSESIDSLQLRATPNGRLLQTLNSAQLKGSLIVGIDDRRHTWLWLINRTKEPHYKDEGEWRRVLYFPPNATQWQEAIIGYIHENQIKLMGFTKAEILLKNIGKENDL